ncbi:MAG: amino acid ABC transporter ATP-binding protein [Planctomycetaceae bacterium]
MIAVAALAADRSGTRILADVTFTVATGAVTVLVGPSGGGKSSVLRCLSGLDPFAAGSVEIAGHRLGPGPQPAPLLERVRRDVGLVFQQFHLFPHLDAIGNVMLGPRVVLGMPVAAARSRAADLLERVGLGGHAHAWPTTLSGGQQQRVAIARALAMEPRVLLLDEPTSALDPTMVGEVVAVIRELARGGQTMVIVSHDHAFAREIASHVVEIVAGRVTRRGPPAEVL